jgi:hypothetical protein
MGMRREVTIAVSARCIYKLERCDAKAVCRGNCNNHYQILLRGEKQGRWTWAQLEKAGMAEKLQRNAIEEVEEFLRNGGKLVNQ